MNFMTNKYNHQKIEKKWAERWVKDKVFSPDLKKSENPYYALFMFPYPSAEGLHIGNFYAFTCVDVMAKYKKLKGFDVFEPVGWDAFGIHSENYALKIGEAPGKMLERTIANFRHQIQAAGLSCDWTREVNTTTPEYYKWTQWIFTKLFEKGLAYQKEAYLNWCPSCKTVLADEQIEGGQCERCKSVPEKRKMKQWFFKITHYADRLLDGLEGMDWSEITKSAQKSWIGKSEGANIRFKTAEGDLSFEVFTTRPDTLFGCTYCVLAPEHDLVSKVVTEEQKQAVEKYRQEAGAKSELARKENKEKTGVFSGAYAINPANQKMVPIWIADYVLAGYGFGAIMAVPAHDERDFSFAKKFGLEIIEVVGQMGEDIAEELGCFVGEGKAINSDFLNGLTTEEAKKAIIQWLEEKGFGKATVNYKLRDWVFSRQRYWGEPIPLIHCENCGWVPVPDDQLPLELPEVEKYEPTDTGESPLSAMTDWVNTICPDCGGPAKRETDTMPNWAGSSWYFLRYIDSQNYQTFADFEKMKYWMPVDLYNGGMEHVTLHLLYSRFWNKFLFDQGLVPTSEPYKRRISHG